MDRHLEPPPKGERHGETCIHDHAACMIVRSWYDLVIAYRPQLHCGVIVRVKPPPWHNFHPVSFHQLIGAGTKNDLVRKLINAINEATDTIPGWDDYIKTHTAAQLWDGKTFGKSQVAVKEMAEARR